MEHLHLPEAMKDVLKSAWYHNQAERLSMKDICEVLPIIIGDMETANIVKGDIEC